mmetsp:Transcript_1650/g.2355  ORF Transcript_1650/g.2355 Transcript_1650/m.2355 type:complete len:1216 (-) Transcript_1650:445-4092(-)
MSYNYPGYNPGQFNNNNNPGGNNVGGGPPPPGAGGFGGYGGPPAPPGPGAGGGYGAPPPPHSGGSHPPPPHHGSHGPPPPGQGPPPFHSGGAPGISTPGSSGAPPPPMMQGRGFQPPPPGAGMNNLNTSMGGMNLNGSAAPTPPKMFTPGPPPLAGPAVTGAPPSTPIPPPNRMMSGFPPAPSMPGAPNTSQGGPTTHHTKPPPNSAPSQFYPSHNNAPPPPGPNMMMPNDSSSTNVPTVTANATNASAPIPFHIQIPKSMMRLTCNKFPNSAALANSTKIPMGGILRPLAPTCPGEEELDVIQPGAAGIIRCKRCRTYVNAYATWIENGRRWRCNICAQLNDCPSAYFCHLDPNTNERRDAYQRPELSKSVVEWIAPSEYMVRPPQPPAFFFVLDVSAQAVRSGMLASASKAILNSLDDLPGGTRTMIGFITYDNAVHYYSLKPGEKSNPQMVVVADLKELFVPAPSDLLVNLQDSKPAISSFLDNLPTMFSKNTVPTSCLGPALKAAYTVMKAIGGKMCVFQSIMPSIGDGSLKPRENIRAMGTPEEVALLKPGVSWYKETAIEFSRAQISVDMFLFPYQYIDCASLKELPKYTAGSLHTYVGFNSTRDAPKFESQLHRCIVQTTAVEAVLRIRCTKGMKLTNYYGNFFVRGTDLLALPNCNTDASFGFDICHDQQSLQNLQAVTIQSALLYTTGNGERRIRVATQAFPIVNQPSDLVDAIDTEALITIMSKQALSLCIRTNLENARNRLQQTCLDVIRCAKEGNIRTVSGYTVPGDKSGEGGKKNIPSHLQLLPLYTLGLIKNVSFRGGTDVHPDERVAAQMVLGSMHIRSCKKFVHPRLFSIHDMDPSAGMPQSDTKDEDEGKEGSDSDSVLGRNKICLPAFVNLSIERLHSEGVFLLDNGVDMYIWVGRAADAAILQHLFQVESLEQVDMNKISLVSSGNDLASRLDSIIQALREEDGNVPELKAKIIIVKEGDAVLESRFYWNLIEDRAQFSGGTYNYTDFMQFINHAGDKQAPPGAPGGAPGRGPSHPMAPPGRPGMAPPGPPGHTGFVGNGSPMPPHGFSAPPGPPNPPMNHASAPASAGYPHQSSGIPSAPRSYPAQGPSGPPIPGPPPPGPPGPPMNQAPPYSNPPSAPSSGNTGMAPPPIPQGHHNPPSGPAPVGAPNSGFPAPPRPSSYHQPPPPGNYGRPPPTQQSMPPPPPNPGMMRPTHM